MPSENSFVPFSQEFYTLPGVESEMLFLQDRYGLNVNMLLFCFWQARAAPTALAHDFFERALGELEQWHDAIVLPVRRARRQLKTVNAPLISSDERDALRASVLEAEIALEVGEQKIICRTHDRAGVEGDSSALGDADPALIRANLKNYAEVRRAADVPEVLASFEKLLSAASRSN